MFCVVRHTCLTDNTTKFGVFRKKDLYAEFGFKKGCSVEFKHHEHKTHGVLLFSGTQVKAEEELKKFDFLQNEPNTQVQNTHVTVKRKSLEDSYYLVKYKSPELPNQILLTVIRDTQIEGGTSTFGVSLGAKVCFYLESLRLCGIVIAKGKQSTMENELQVRSLLHYSDESDLDDTQDDERDVTYEPLSERESQPQAPAINKIQQKNQQESNAAIYSRVIKQEKPPFTGAFVASPFQNPPPAPMNDWTAGLHGSQSQRIVEITISSQSPKRTKVVIPSQGEMNNDMNSITGSQPGSSLSPFHNYYSQDSYEHNADSREEFADNEQSNEIGIENFSIPRVQPAVHDNNNNMFNNEEYANSYSSSQHQSVVDSQQSQRSELVSITRNENENYQEEMRSQQNNDGNTEDNDSESNPHMAMAKRLYGTGNEFILNQKRRLIELTSNANFSSPKPPTVNVQPSNVERFSHVSNQKLFNTKRVSGTQSTPSRTQLNEPKEILKEPAIQVGYTRVPKNNANAEVSEWRKRAESLQREMDEMKLEMHNSRVNKEARKVDSILHILRKAHPQESRLLENPPNQDEKYIGLHVTVNAMQYNFIDFMQPYKAVKELALLHFGLDVLKTHTVSGRRCPTKEGPAKPKLPTHELTDIIVHVKNEYEKLNGDLTYAHGSNSKHQVNFQDLKKAIMRKTHDV